MSESSNLHHHDIPPFSFYYQQDEVEVEVNVAPFENTFGVHINGVIVAHVALDNDGHTWYKVDGNLNDDTLVKEVGERIEAKLY